MITMNKKGHKNQAERSSRRLWITLLFFCFTVTGFMQAANAVFAQTTVTATFKNATLSEVLWEVQRQTDFTFVYSTEEVKNVKVEKLIVNHEKIANVLDKCLKGSGLTVFITVHSGWTPKKGEPRVLPIYQSTTFKYETSEQMARLFDLEESGYFYTRLQNPTNDAVAAKIAASEGGVAGMLTSSGQAANFYAIFNICQAGYYFVAISHSILDKSIVCLRISSYLSSSVSSSLHREAFRIFSDVKGVL